MLASQRGRVNSHPRFRIPDVDHAEPGQSESYDAGNTRTKMPKRIMTATTISPAKPERQKGG